MKDAELQAETCITNFNERNYAKSGRCIGAAHAIIPKQNLAVLFFFPYQKSEFDEKLDYFNFQISISPPIFLLFLLTNNPSLHYFPHALK